MADRGSLSVWRCRSMDDIINFSSVKPKLKNIVSKLEEICEDTRTRKESLPWKAGGAAAAGGLAAFTVLTGGVGLIVAGVEAAVGAAAGAGAVVALDTLLDQNTIDKVKRLVEEFCDLVQPLKNVQPEKRAMLKELNKKVEETIILLESLIDRLLILFIDFKSNSTLQRLLEVTEQCKNILKELEELMKNF